MTKKEEEKYEQKSLFNTEINACTLEQDEIEVSPESRKISRKK